ncbi:putative ribonuclease H-like domain-containing protein [Tanacetum coccineum]
MSGEEPATQIAPMESPQMVSTVKLPILKKGEYTLWSIRIEQYLTNIDYSLWQVILNVDGPIQVTTNENGVETEVAIKSRFGGNVESKKMQKTVLNQQYENFSVSDTEGLDKAYDRFQKLISLLEVHGAAFSNEDANQKFLRALPSSWNNVALIMRNKASIDDLDINDLYNNLKVFEADIKGSSGSSSKSQNVAFLSVEDTSGSNEVNTANVVSTASGHNSQGQASSSSYTDDLMFSFFANQSNSPQLDDEDLEYRSRDNTRRTVPVETSDALVVQDNTLIVQDGLFDEQRPTLSKANIEIVAYQLGLESVEAQLVVYQKNEVVYEKKITILKFKVKDKNKTGLGYGDQLDENDSSGSEFFKSAFDSRSSDGEDNQTNDWFKKDNGYHAVPHPLTGNYMPLLADLSFAGLYDSVYRPIANKTSASVSQVSDDEDIFQSNDLQATDKPSFKRIEFTNARNESVKPKQAKKPSIFTQNPNHQIKDCDFHEKRMAKKSVLKNMGKTSSKMEIRPLALLREVGSLLLRPQQGNPQQALKNKGIFDSGCSRHMTGNKDFLTDYQDIDGGFVAFGGSARGGKITGKGKIRTDKLDFEDVFFVKELKFNLFSVLQMCDKKNNVLFIETECLVLSPDFKLLDESQVLLRVPRQSNMYSFDLKNVVPSGDLTCLFAKATIDESKSYGIGVWKGKQHKASCKAKLMSSIIQPLQMLHMDLFGPTSVRSINHKTYCLVVTNDFSRFSWVFFLASKDETSGILKRFITEIENQLNHKVKVIRCDNGKEFKNREMNELCDLKGIKREFSVARTPQQNGVAKRKNMTLIKAARTMLADSLLPTVFWAEAVNTACYVLNRVLVIKPHNKTPYELIIGRPPNISFMRPFECPVTILNSLDPLGKFDGKAEEGFLVGYSVNSKAFRVFNSQTRKVEENLHVNFLENKPNVAGQGPNWLFNIDSLTNSINYQPVTAGNQTNKNAGPQEANGDTGLKKSVDARKSEGKNVSTQQYIVFPFGSYSLSYKSSDETYKNDTADETPVQKPASENEQTLKNCNKELLQGKVTKALIRTNSFYTVRTPVNTACAFDDEDLDTLQFSIADQSLWQEPTKIAQVLDDESRVEAMQEESAISKRFKIEAIMLFLAYASFMNFLVYQMDVNSAFLYGTIEEEPIKDDSLDV